MTSATATASRTDPVTWRSLDPYFPSCAEGRRLCSRATGASATVVRLRRRRGTILGGPARLVRQAANEGNGPLSLGVVSSTGPTSTGAALAQPGTWLAALGTWQNVVTGIRARSSGFCLTGKLTANCLSFQPCPRGRDGIAGLGYYHLPVVSKQAVLPKVPRRRAKRRRLPIHPE